MHSIKAPPVDFSQYGRVNPTVVAVDAFQEKVHNEGVVGQRKDEVISDCCPAPATMAAATARWNMWLIKGP